MGRFFSGVWALIDGVYKLLVILSVLLLVGVVVLAFHGGAPSKIEDNVALVVYPTGTLTESTDQDPTERFIEGFIGEPPAQTPLRNLTDALNYGAKDPRITLAVLKLDAMKGAGIAQLQELATAVKTFRAAGKPVYAYGPYFDQNDYLVAAQADSVALDPMGTVFLQGLDVYQNYFKEALDKLGVDVHVFRVGEYKSAVEPFERNDMSPEAREASKKWLNDLWSSYGREVGHARQLPDSAMNDYTAGLAVALQKAGGDAATVARDSKFVDTIETLQQFRTRIAGKVGWDDDHGTFRQIHHREYLDVLEREKKLAPPASVKKIGLVVVQGEIVDGDSQQGEAGADTIADLLTDAREDEDVAAVVLRVDSPGGSVFASERIRREVQSLQAEGKPVVVSMGDVAASGGYWISMDADEIWAHDTTITGSIGIFGLIPTFDKPLAKLGIHTDGIGTTSLAGAFRGDRPLSPEVSIIIQSQIEQGYKLFTEGVAAARELPIEKVREIARGRVWSGNDALKLGLVDQLGSLDDAVASAVRLAGLEPEAYKLEEIRQPHDLPFRHVLELLGNAQVRASLGSFAPLAALDPVQEAAHALRWLNDPRGTYAHCLCTPSPSRRAR